MTLPSLTASDDWRSWARKLSVFLNSQEDRGGRALIPAPVLLSHSTDAASNIGIERNFQDGIMLFDPVNRYIILSRDDLWVPIFDAITVASIFNSAAYGSMVLTSPASGSDIPVGSFITITQFDTVNIPGRGITLDASADTVSFEFEGVYRVSLMFAIEHNELNSSRQFELRLFNVNDASGLSSTVIGIGRNVGVTNFTASFLVNISVSDVDDVYRVEVGNADTVISSVVWETLNLSIDMVSEWKESLTV